MPDIMDNAGTMITSNESNWYKIALADGSELGLDSRSFGASNDVIVVPAGQGMVVRYQRQDGKNIAHQGWPHGDKGWLRGLQVRSDGTTIVKNLSLSAGLPYLSGYDSNNNYGFLTHQLPQNRIALYAYNGKGTLSGLRVTPEGRIVGHDHQYAMGLDCAFVEVGGHYSGYF